MNRKCLFGLVIFIVTTTSLYAQKSEKETSTSNFKGFRDRMSSNGISFQPRLTLFQQNFVISSNSICKNKR